MEPWTRKRNCRHLLVVSLSCSSVLLSPWTIVTSQAVANEQTATKATLSNVDKIYKRLHDLELKVLGKPCDSDLVTVRLERLEKKLFGNEKTGEIKHRLDALLIASELTQTASPGADLADDENSESVQIDNDKPVAANTIKSNDDGATSSASNSSSKAGSRIEGKPTSGGLLSIKHDGISKLLTMQLETEIFGKSYVEEPLPERLSRLEKAVFPQEKASIDKSVRERVRRLTEAVPLSTQSAKDSSIQGTDAPAPWKASAYAPKIDMVTPNVPPPPEPKPKPETKTLRQLDVDYGPWLRDLERRLKRAWLPPRMTGEKKVAWITFVVSKNGQMSMLRMLESSGAALCDQAAIKSAENASPFRPLPEGVGSLIDEVPIFVSFSYDGTVENASQFRPLPYDGTVGDRSSDSPVKKVTASTIDDRTLAKSNPELFDALQRNLEELWHPNSSSTKKHCELQFWTDSTNTEEVKVAKSSGDTDFDEQARRAVKALLPISVKNSSYTLLRGKFGSDRSIVVCAEDEADFGPYLASIQQKLKGNWNPPKGDETKRVQVVFKLLRDGRIEQPLITTASGVESADSAALAAVTKSSPLPALPANAPADGVDIQFTFDYDVFKSASNPQSQGLLSLEYKKPIADKIRANFKVNGLTAKKSVHIDFKVNADGSLSSDAIDVWAPSGMSSFDNAIKQAILAAAPFTAPPNRDSVVLQIYCKSGTDNLLLREPAEDSRILKNHILKVSNQIRQLWRPPAGYDGCIARVKLNVRNDGTLTSATIVKSSDATLFDQAALTFLRNLSSLPTFPDYVDDGVTMEISLPGSLAASASNAPGTFRKFPDSTSQPSAGNKALSSEKQQEDKTAKETEFLRKVTEEKALLRKRATQGDVEATLSVISDDTTSTADIINYTSNIIASSKDPKQTGVWLYKRMMAYKKQGVMSSAFSDLDALTKLKTGGIAPLKDGSHSRIFPEALESIGMLVLERSKQQSAEQALPSLEEGYCFITNTYTDYLNDGCTRGSPLFDVKDFETVFRTLCGITDQWMQTAKIGQQNAQLALEIKDRGLNLRDHWLGHWRKYLEAKAEEGEIHSYKDLLVQQYTKEILISKLIGDDQTAFKLQQKKSAFTTKLEQDERAMKEAQERSAAELEEWRRKNPNAPAAPSGF